MQCNAMQIAMSISAKNKKRPQNAKKMAADKIFLGILSFGGKVEWG